MHQGSNELRTRKEYVSDRDAGVVSKNTNELKTGSPGRFVINVSTLGWPMGARILGVLSENANGAARSNPRGVLKTPGDQPIAALALR